jgi:hypothetical protein
MTQDALENLFAQVRGYGDDHPSAIHFRHSLKLITMSQFMEVPKTSSYDTDDCPNLIDCLKQISTVPTEVDIEFPCNNLSSIDTVNPGPGSEEEKSLYDLAGWVGKKLKKEIDDCNNCLPLVSSTEISLPQASLTVKRSLGGLTHPSTQLFELISEAESYFRNCDLYDKSVGKITEEMLENCE